MNFPKVVAAQLLFILFWSSGFIGAKFGLEYAGVFTFMFLRYAILALILLSISLYLYSRRTINWACLSQLAVIGVLAHALYLSLMSMAFTLGATAGNAALIGALQPLLTGVLARYALAEHYNPIQWLGLFIGFCAVLLIVSNGMTVGSPLIANTLLLLSVGCITAASLHQRWLDAISQEKPVPLMLNFTVQCTISAVLLGLLSCFIEGGNAQWSVDFVFVLLWMALAVSLGGFGTMWYLLQRRPATQVTCLTYATVPVTMIMGYLAFGENLDTIDFIGFVLAAVGIRLTTHPPGKSNLCVSP